MRLGFPERCFRKAVDQTGPTCLMKKRLYGRSLSFGTCSRSEAAAAADGAEKHSFSSACLISRVAPRHLEGLQRKPTHTHTRVHRDEQRMCNEEEKTHLQVAAVFSETGRAERNSRTHLWLALWTSLWLGCAPPTSAAITAAPTTVLLRRETCSEDTTK